jgi:hypothetical protein
MKDPILQEVREARAAVSADFDFDLHKFFEWAKTHTAAEQKATHRLQMSPKNSLKPPSGASEPSVARKRRARPTTASA